MTQGINEANELYNEKLINFNKQILSKNSKLLEYKNKISVLKIKINELHEELNKLRGSTTAASNINNNSFFNTSFINNSIINTNPNQKINDKIPNNNNVLNKNYSTISNRITTQNRQKKLLGLNPYNSKTVDRREIKEYNTFSKKNSSTNINYSKDEENLNIEKKLNNEINNKNEILIPQTPQIKKEIIPLQKNDEILTPQLNKDFYQINNDIIISQTPQINKDLYKINNEIINAQISEVNIEHFTPQLSNENKKIQKPQINNEKNQIQNNQLNKELFRIEINNDKFENKKEIKVNKNSEIQDFINKNKEEDKNRINFLNEYREILDKYGSNLNQTVNKKNN